MFSIFEILDTQGVRVGTFEGIWWNIENLRILNKNIFYESNKMLKNVNQYESTS